MRKTRLNLDPSGLASSETKKLVSLWVLRMLVNLGGYKEFNNIRNEEKVLELFDKTTDDILLDEPSYRKLSQSNKTSLLEFFTKQLKIYDKQKQPKLPRVLSSNIDKLSLVTSLNSYEKQILGFVIMLNSVTMLEDVTDIFSNIQTNGVIEILSVVLSIDRTIVRRSVMPNSTLCKTGLLSFEKNSASFISKVELISRAFADRMTSMDCDLFDILKEVVRKCDSGKLNMCDYEQINTFNEILIPYLRKCVASAKVGVNILIYGQPGTGKTEYVKTVAKELGLQLAEISFADDDEEPMEPEYRLKALKFAQTFFAKQKSLLLFDEAEDVFTLSTSNIFSFTKSTQKNKAWINRALEQNIIPTIWVTNSIYGLDEAVLRRFDMVFEIPMPTKKKKQELISKECGSLITDELAQNLASCEYLSPAILSKTVDVIRDIKLSTQESSSKALETLLSSFMEAQGKRYEKISQKHSSNLSYNPEYINSDMELNTISGGIKATKNARICLYGPPGTGKSAFGKWIADELDKPLLLKKGSDLISMYVGGTEKNIANAFREAVEDSAVLVIDEVDSFLQDRRAAQKSWEITAVNEMLVQMENFNGVFIATTNLIEGLDQASLRRFDLKLKFDYLSKMQRLNMFTDFCKTLGIDNGSSKINSEIARLDNLTPGDFAAVNRQSRFNPIKDCTDLVDRLYKECEIKDGDKSSIKMGFVN